MLSCAPEQIWLPRLQIYVPLHCYYSLHMVPTSLHISLKKGQTAMFILYSIVIFVPPTYMPIKCHSQINWYAYIGKYANLYAWHELAAITMLPKILYTHDDSDNAAQLIKRHSAESSNKQKQCGAIRIANVDPIHVLEPFSISHVSFKITFLLGIHNHWLTIS